MQANREDARSAPGRYLVRSGSVYLFQIRMPHELAGGRCRIFRIGLGALTAREARRQANLLGALARIRFDQIRAVKMDRHGQEKTASAMKARSSTAERPSSTVLAT